MILQGQVGPQVNSDGIFANARQGRAGEVIIAESNPRYYENTYRGQKFTVQYAAAALAAAAAASSFILFNPTGSGKNLVLLDAYVAVTPSTAQAASTAVVLGWTAVPSTPGTIGTLIAPANCLIGNGNQSVAKAAPTATYSAIPTFARTLASLYGDLAAGDITGVHDDIGGAIIVTPGYGLAIYGIGGTPADLTILPQLTWDEVAI